ncbi:MAG: lipopolysaccharide assembly protein LapA domain-containing protein [Oceanococcus sp.]
MQKIIVLIVLIAMFCMGAAFSYHNPQPVTLNYLIGQADVPVGALLMSVTAAVISLMVLMAWLLALPGRAERLRLRRRLERAEKELDKLRQLPLKDG